MTRSQSEIRAELTEEARKPCSCRWDVYHGETMNVPILGAGRKASCPCHGDGSRWWKRVSERSRELAIELGLIATEEP